MKLKAYLKLGVLKCVMLNAKKYLEVLIVS